ncbi:MAG: TIGR02677 family protein [Ectobacillus sp.]
MDSSWLKAIPEAKYLSVENAYRYRAILRFFYMQHERMKQYLFPEEIYAFVKQYEAFSQYTEDELQQDLDQLVRWKNLIARQEMGKVRTIEEFKKKRFRYQCSPYTVEIERMIRSLEQMGDSFGGSLEKTLFERLYTSLAKMEQIIAEDFSEKDEECSQVWKDTFDYFKKIIQNSADYIAYLHSENMEEHMMSEAFLLYKDQFTAYLRDFIIALQQTAFQIERVLQDITNEGIRQFAAILARDQLKVPRFEEGTVPHEALREEYVAKWESLKEWFLGRDGRDSELQGLQHQTNEMIRRMTRMIQRLGERYQNVRSRKKDYVHLAKWFMELQDMKEAHELSSVVFGCFHTRHFITENTVTEDIYRDVWEEEPTVWTVKPRVRHYREKTKPGAIETHRKQKDEMRQQYLQQKQREQEEIQGLIQDNRIVLRSLPVVSSHIRKTLLSWIAKSMSTEDGMVKTETGMQIQVVKAEGAPIELVSTDGTMIMPDFEIVVLHMEGAR